MMDVQDNLASNNMELVWILPLLNGASMKELHTSIDRQ
jgi:hypothetical protein